MIAYLDQTDSPAGPFVFATDAQGVLIRSSFLEGEYALSIEQELERDGHQIDADHAITEKIRRQIDEYTNGDRVAFEIDVKMAGTEWQQRVWRELMNIPFGELRTYGEVASVVCTPRAARAVGRANATNPIPLVVPCHRVVGANGSLTGFGGGLHLKTRLLEHEMSLMRQNRDESVGIQQSLTFS
jgi:methylated-DNA-[protein]-cysteine S-methyltransferase